jgi:cell division protease FtsH
MKFINFIIISFYSFSNAFYKHNLNKNTKFKFKNKFLQMSNVEDLYDLNMINQFKYYFKNDNYNNIITNILDNKISKILVDNNYKQIVSIDNSQDYLPNDNFPYFHYSIAEINPILIPNLIEKTSQFHIPISFVDFTPHNLFNVQDLINNFFSLINNAFPILFILYFLSILRNINSGPMPPSNMNINRMNNNNNPFSFVSLFKKKENDNFLKPNVTLDSWVGSPEVIEECREVISYIENKEKFNLIGAFMPKGILLEGPPGTGKTLLAKAIATETKSTFISISGSEFVEIFVGVGAARVRELFDKARENKPCIIFIDEIDAVVKQRGGGGVNMGNDEKEQTLNQLLYEMDGFNNNDDILVIAATNRKDVLDQALLRPGRFDRIIRIPLPDKESREKILTFYFENKNMNKKPDISSITELTEGYSGAQLKNLINEAAILSARNNYTIIQEKYIFEAYEKSIVGLIKKNVIISPTTKLRVSIHESGHALLALKFNEYFDFQKASIQPTYNGAGGYTLFNEKSEIREGGLYTKDILKKKLIILMGGKAAETIYYGNNFVSLGAFQDLKQANLLAKRMIGNFGMGNKLEVFYNEDIKDDILNPNFGFGEKYSDNTRNILDKETLDLVKDAYLIAMQILEKNRWKLIYFSELLQNNTVIYNRDLKDTFDMINN